MGTNKEKDDSIELRSEEFQEILGEIPSWILRYGITVIGIVVLMLLIGSSLFKYPDTISTTMTLTGVNPPAVLVARTTGKLQDISIIDNQDVKVGDYLAVIENPAERKDVIFLKSYIHAHDNYCDTLIELPYKNLKLGGMQALYASFYSTLFEHNEFVRLRYYIRKIEYTKERIDQYRSYYEGLIQQNRIICEQASLSEIQYQRDFSLQTKGLISDEALETTKNQLLQSQLSVESANTTLQNTEIQITQMEESLLDMEYQHQERRNTLETKFYTYITQLLAEIQTWEQNYLFVSPVNGRITFTNYWTENQNVTSGDVVFSIVPVDEGKLFGKAVMDMARSGKVKPGQKVNMRFISFDENEFGQVKGVVKNISLVPVKGSAGSNYVVEIDLPEGLKTSYGKELPFLPEMEAQADIVVEDVSVLDRIIMPLKKILKNQ